MGALHRASRRTPQPAGIRRKSAIKNLKVPDDDLEQVVEVVGDPASQLTDRFHFLRLPKRLFILAQLGRSLADLLFQCAIEPA
jgi:hypothetical protein